MTQRQFLVLVRHGQSEANLRLQSVDDDALYYSLSGSDPSVGLTTQGFGEGAAVGDQLAQLFPSQKPLQRVYHTDFKRVEETVEAIDAKLPYDVPRQVDPRLNKRNYGEFWNLTRRGVEVLHPQEWARYLLEGDLNFRAPGGGENYPDVFARVDDFIDTELSASRENMLVVTHSVVILAFRRRIEGLSDEEVIEQYEQISLANGEVLVYERCSKEGQSWHLAHFPSIERRCN
jgi:2,3-bisphosphoglycerate-dependent phosphoglycerate mutase